MASKILIVDDESDVELLMKLRFRDRVRKGDYDLSFARDGVEALEKLEAGDFDLMLTDINMPRMDGLALLDEVQGRFPDLQTVVVSAYGDINNIRVAMNCGSFDFLTKPMEFEDLEITVVKALRHARRVREGHRAEEYRRAKEVAERDLVRQREVESLRESLTQMMVHDLRTPLTSLLSGMQTMEVLGALDPLQREFLHIAVQGGEALLRMINDLLDVWKMRRCGFKSKTWTLGH